MGQTHVSNFEGHESSIQNTYNKKIFNIYLIFNILTKETRYAHEFTLNF